MFITIKDELRAYFPNINNKYTVLLRIMAIPVEEFSRNGYKINCSQMKFLKFENWSNRRACGHVDVGTRLHQVFASTLTLSQPGGADYAHPILMSTPSFESHRRAC